MSTPAAERGARGATGARGQTGRWRLSLAIAVIALIVSLGANITTYKVLSDEIQHNNEAHVALCSSRHNTIDSIKASQQYLRDVASGKRKPVPGISTNDIRQSIQRQQAYLKTLDVLHCDG